MVAWFRREPAQWLGLVAAAVQLFSALIFPLSEAQQGALNAVAVAVVGVVTAAAVSAEKAAPLVAGLVQAILALSLAFGAELSSELQSSVMAFVAAGVGFWLRTQVTAPAEKPRLSANHPARSAE